MSGSRVTVTLGPRGPVVNKTGGFSDEGIWNGVAITGGKRSIKDRLGAGYEDRSESYNKRTRGESTSNSIDMCLGKDDLRFKLMQKNTRQYSLHSEPLGNVDLREKLLNRTFRPSADAMTMRPLGPTGNAQHFMLDPRIDGTRQPVLESRDTSILGRFPPSRNPIELPVLGPPRNNSSWTLENLRRRSPEALRRKSPDALRRRSPEALRRRSPDAFRRTSLVGSRQRSPVGLRQRSPVALRQRSPVGLRQRSPVDLRQRSPVSLRQRSPGGLRQRSPNGLRQRSPDGLRQRSPDGLRRRSPEGLRRRSPEDFRRISPEGLRRRSPDVLSRRSPQGLRQRSPERFFHPSVRGVSPGSRNDLQRRPLGRPYDNERSTAYVRVSPRRGVRSSPYLAQSSLPVPPLKSSVPASHYAQASGVMRRTPNAVDVPPTVDTFLRSLGLERYANCFKAEQLSSPNDRIQDIKSFLLWHLRRMPTICRKFAELLNLATKPDIDMKELRQLGDGDLRGLGIPVGPRRAILDAVMSHPRRPR